MSDKKSPAPPAPKPPVTVPLTRQTPGFERLRESVDYSERNDNTVAFTPAPPAPPRPPK